MKVRVASNGNITPTARKSSARLYHSPTRPGVLAEKAASTQILLTGKCSPPARTMSFHRGLRRVGWGRGLAHAHGACLLMD